MVLAADSWKFVATSAGELAMLRVAYLVGHSKSSVVPREEEFAARSVYVCYLSGLKSLGLTLRDPKLSEMPPMVSEF